MSKNESAAIVLQAVIDAEREVDQELNDYAAQFPMPAMTNQQPEINPLVASIAAELGDNTILMEATLAWVRQKKKEIAGAMLVALYGEAIKAKQEELLASETNDDGAGNNGDSSQP